MENKAETSNALEGMDTKQIDYKYNFINTPWDDRSHRSKIGIIGLLCAIFLATMAVVVHNFIIFYKGFQTNTFSSSTFGEISCNLVKVDRYSYVARIHSTTSLELICVGAMVSSSSVIANSVCIKSGPIRLYLGSLADHRCKKGFSVEVMETIPHDGVVTKRLVLLTIHENLKDCGSVIRLSSRINFKHPVFVIGRPYRGGRTLSFQPATLSSSDNLTYSVGISTNNLNKQNLICIKHLSKCPVRAGDLLVQRGRLIGIASTSTQWGKYNEMACFADLSVVHDELRELNVSVEFDSGINNDILDSILSMKE